MRSAPNRLGLEALPPYVDMIELRDGDCIDFFARNWQGVHVPITTMGPAEMWRAHVQWSDSAALVSGDAA